MNERSPDALAIAPPSLPKGGGAIQSIGKNWDAVGPAGAATLAILLPLSPSLAAATHPTWRCDMTAHRATACSATAGRCTCPFFWRHTANGVPAYLPEDEIVGPSDDVLLRDATGGAAFWMVPGRMAA